MSIFVHNVLQQNRQTLCNHLIPFFLPLVKPASMIPSHFQLFVLADTPSGMFQI